MIDHEHDYSPEMIQEMTGHVEKAVEHAMARDSRICKRCLHLGFAVGQIVAVELLIKHGNDTADMHAALQLLYSYRDSYFGHHPETVVQ